MVYSTIKQIFTLFHSFHHGRNKIPCPINVGLALANETWAEVTGYQFPAWPLKKASITSAHALEASSLYQENTASLVWASEGNRGVRRGSNPAVQSRVSLAKPQTYV